ncbi:MAG: FHA domain-containing protein, partial [Deltaproteobacteria bacterium]
RPSPPGAAASQSHAGVGMPTAPPGQMNRPAPPPPQVAQRPPPPVAQAPAQRSLIARCEGEEFPVAKEEFFIGRGQKLCDLVIRDTNISRQHARVVLHNGQFWMMDNQSTNGVEFRGAKIQQKRIDDGDVFTICGHDILFNYR